MEMDTSVRIACSMMQEWEAAALRDQIRCLDYWGTLGLIRWQEMSGS